MSELPIWGPEDVFLIHLMINGDRLPVSLVDFDYLCFRRGKSFYFFFFHVSVHFSFAGISHFSYSLHPFFHHLRRASTEFPIHNRILLMLYYRYGRYGGSWERRRWIQVSSFPIPYPTSFCLRFPFFVKLERNGIFLPHYACVR